MPSSTTVSAGLQRLSQAALTSWSPHGLALGPTCDVLVSSRVHPQPLSDTVRTDERLRASHAGLVCGVRGGAWGQMEKEGLIWV